MTLNLKTQNDSEFEDATWIILQQQTIYIWLKQSRAYASAADDAWQREAEMKCTTAALR
jgi:hypothetical protein